MESRRNTHGENPPDLSAYALKVSEYVCFPFSLRMEI